MSDVKSVLVGGRSRESWRNTGIKAEAGVCYVQYATGNRYHRSTLLPRLIITKSPMTDRYGYYVRLVSAWL